MEKKTLTTLKANHIPASKINIVVHTQEQKKLYEAIPKELYGNILVSNATDGLVGQMNFIYKHFPEGKEIVSFDDDISAFQKKVGIKLEVIHNFNTIIEKGFRLCKEKGLSLWGVYPTANGLWMKDTITDTLKFIVGPVLGVINRKIKLTFKYKMDYELTLKSFKRDGGVLRINNIAFRTSAPGVNTKGGIGKSGQERLADNIRISKELVKAYPDLVRINNNPSRKGEILLKSGKIEGGKITDTTKYDLVDRENDELIVDKIVVSQKVKGLQSILLTALEDAYIPKIEQKRNDGKPTRGGLIGYDGYTFTLGCGRRRGLGSGEFATNKRNQDVLGAAIHYGNAILPKGFQYTTITINKNLQAKKHIDGGNNGMGFITFLGDFTGGNLSVWDRDGKERSLSAKNNLIGFNGAKLPHQTQDFKGERYALIYYKQKQACDVKGYTMRGSGIKTSIPVHQIFVPFEEGKTITDFPLFEKSISEMKQLSSSYKLWGHKELETLMKKYPKYYPMWKNARYGIQKVDIGKMVILYDKGGVYADLDILPNDIKSLNTLKEFDEKAVFGEDDDSVNVELIYSQKGNQMFLQILDYMKEQIGEKSKQKIYDTWKGRYVLQTTGPRMLGRFIKDNKPDIKIIPINLSYDWNKPKKSGTLFTTYHMGSWLKSVNPKLKRRDA